MAMGSEGLMWQLAAGMGSSPLFEGGGEHVRVALGVHWGREGLLNDSGWEN